jgi:hypothetical protein
MNFVKNSAIKNFFRVKMQTFEMSVLMPISNVYCVMTQTPNSLNIVQLVLSNTLYFICLT